MANLFKKIIKGKAYWYMGESKRINGKVKRIWQKYIGPVEKVAEELQHGPIPKEVDVLNLGVCGALMNINKDINFVNSVNKIVKKREQGLTHGEHILLTIMNRIDNPQSKNKLGNWFDGTILKRIYPVNKSYLSSQNFWNHWNKMSDKHIEKIQELLLTTLVKQCDVSELYFDPTNFTTHIQEHKNQDIMQFGHSKDGKKGLRQVNLSLLVTKKDGVPLWHNTYDGNINDVTEFKELIKTLTKRIIIFSRKCRKITLVFDKGNNSRQNIENVDKKLSFFMVGSLKPSQFPELFDIPKSEFEEEYQTAVGKKVYCAKKVMNVYDGKKKVIITYSHELAYKNKIRIDKALNKAIQKLKTLEKRIKKTNFSRDELLLKVDSIVGKQYIKGLIDYKISEKGKLIFSKDEKVYREKSKRFGKNILFTDDLSLKTKEIVKIYNNKNIVEEQIKNLKDTHVISFTPMWCWTDKMIKVHAFTCVMSLLFLRLLVKKAREGYVRLSQNEILDQLKKINLTLFKMPRSNSIHTKITRLNDSQRTLARIFGIREYAK